MSKLLTANSLKLKVNLLFKSDVEQKVSRLLFSVQ